MSAQHAPGAAWPLVVAGIRPGARGPRRGPGSPWPGPLGGVHWQGAPWQPGNRGRGHGLPQAGRGPAESALLRAPAPHKQACRRISAQFNTELAASKLAKNKERPILGDIAAAFKGAAFYHRRGCDASVFKAVLSVL